MIIRIINNIFEVSSHTVCVKTNQKFSIVLVCMSWLPVHESGSLANGVNMHIFKSPITFFGLVWKTSVCCVNVLLFFIRMPLSAVLDHCAHLQTQMTLTCPGKLAHQRNCVSLLHITLYYQVHIEHFYHFVLHRQLFIYFLQNNVSSNLREKLVPSKQECQELLDCILHVPLYNENYGNLRSFKRQNFW